MHKHSYAVPLVSQSIGCRVEIQYGCPYSHIPSIGQLLNYEELYSISPEETILMKGIYKQPPKPKKLKMATHTLAISEGHSSQLAMR